MYLYFPVILFLLPGLKLQEDFQSKSKAERDSYCSVCGCAGGCNLCDDISKYRISEQLKYYI